MSETRAGVQGRMHVDFALHGSATAARITDAAAPLELRGPFAGEGVSSFYLRNVSCGVFAGDAYEIRLRAAEGARVSISATSATRVHAMRVRHATSEIAIRSAPHAAIAFYDGPTILQEGAAFTQRVVVEANEGVAIYAEVLVAGRLASGECLAFRRYRSELIVRGMDGRELYVERYELRPNSDRSSIEAASFPVRANVIIAGAAESALDGLGMTGEGVTVGSDTLPWEAGLVLRAGGHSLEPIARLVERTVSHVLDVVR